VNCQKTTPRYPGHRESKLPSIPDTSKKWLPRVPDTGESFFFFLDFLSNFKSLTLTLKQQPIKNSINWLFTVYIHFILVLKYFLTSLFLLQLQVSRTPGSLFKMYITPRKFAKNYNGSRTSVVGPRGVVWWEKKKNSKISCYCPFKEKAFCREKLVFGSTS